MTQYQLLQSIPVLSTLTSLKLPVKKAYSIYGLAKKANEIREFFVEEEKKLITQYNGKIGENGRISFEKTEDFQNFNKEYAELKNTEIDGIQPVVLKIAELGEQSLSAEDLAILDGVVDFIDEE